MRNALVLVLVLVAPAVDALTASTVSSEDSVRVTHRHLEPVCVGDAAVRQRQREWPTVATPVALTLTMRNEPRWGADNRAPGYATVQFTPARGHRYEVEVRAGSSTFSRRVWPEGQWTPVVRDRTTDQIVSTAPTWGPPPCEPASAQR